MCNDINLKGGHLVSEEFDEREELRKFEGQIVKLKGTLNKRLKKSVYGKKMRLFTNVQILGTNIIVPHVWISSTKELFKVNDGEEIIFNAVVYRYTKKVEVCGIPVSRSKFGFDRIRNIVRKEAK